MEILLQTPVLLAILVIATCAKSLKIVHQSKIGIVERLGRYHKKAERGVNIIVPYIDRLRLVDLREQVSDFAPQAVITKDNVTINIDTVVYFQITDPVKFLYEIADPLLAIENLTATTLRNIIGELDLDATLSSRDVINAKLRTVLDEVTDKWGIRVNRVEIKNIEPPREIQTAMEKQMKAERERRAAILQAEGEKQSAILKAEGEKESAIRIAEGKKQSQILDAQGQAESILLVQQAKAEGIKKVLSAVKDVSPTREVLAIRALEAFEKVSEGQATKLIVPSEAVSLLGAIAGAGELLKKEPTARGCRGDENGNSTF